jgi:hypothetical protein
MRLALAAVVPLAAALVLAGCGGGSRGVRATTGAVAGAQTEQQFTTASFANSAGALEQQVSAMVMSMRHNSAAGQADMRGVVRANCQGTLATQLAQRAHTAQEHAIVAHLRTACADLTQAAQQGHFGHAAAAKGLAARALAAAKAAAALTKR